MEHARDMVKDAIRCYLTSLRKDGEEILVEQGEASTERVAVTLPW